MWSSATIRWRPPSISMAEADAEVKRILAEAEAEANKKIAESLTDEVLAKLYYDKWDGKLPYYYGSDGNTLIQVPNP